MASVGVSPLPIDPRSLPSPRKILALACGFLIYFGRSVSAGQDETILFPAGPRIHARSGLFLPQP